MVISRIASIALAVVCRSTVAALQKRPATGRSSATLYGRVRSSLRLRKAVIQIGAIDAMWSALYVADLAAVAWNRLPLAGGGDRFGDR
jgi:hypothetical protein